MTHYCLYAAVGQCHPPAQRSPRTAILFGVVTAMVIVGMGVLIILS